MKTNLHCLMLLGLFPLFFGFGQEKPLPEATPDSAVTLEVIPFNEILIAAGESRIRTIRMAESLIGRDQIEQENRRNDSILALIDSALTSKKNADYSQQSQRFLTNERNYWQIPARYVANQKNRLSGLIRNLQDKHGRLAKERQKWKNTESLKDTSYAFGNVEDVIATTTRMLDSFAGEIEERTELLIVPLNKTISTQVETELLLEKIQQAILKKSSSVYSKTSPALFEQEPTESEGQGIFRKVRSSLRSEANALLFYFQQHRNAYILYLIFLFGILVLFSWIKTRLKFLRADNLNYYEKTFKAVLQRPLSAGMLFGLFFTMAFFPDRPPLLVDIIILVLLIPLLDITQKLTPKKVHKYLWGFAVLLLLQLGIGLLPVETLLYRYALLAMGIAELLILFRLYRQPEVLKLPNHTLTRFVRFLIVFHLVAVIVGMAANIFGYSMFAQAAIGSFLTNTLVGIILFISAIILTGGIQFFIGGSYLDRFQTIRDHEEYLKGIMARTVFIGVTLFWLDAILRIFYLKAGAHQFLGNLFTHDLTLGSMSFSLGKIVLFFFIIWLSIILSRIIIIILRADVLNKLPLKKGVPRMVTAITQFSLISLGLLFAIRAIGMPLDQLTIIFSAFSVGIGFGLQNIFNNLVSGVILLFERPVQIGDTVEVGNLIGKVQSMGIRSSNIHTFDGAEVIVPNGLLISQEVVNWTLSDKTRRIEVISGVAYGSDVHLVRKLLLQVLEEHPEVIKTPPPLVLFNALGESSLDFRLLFWTDHFDEWLRIRSEVIFAIHDILYANNISIPFPQRDLHLKSVDPSVFRDQQGSGPQEAP